MSERYPTTWVNDSLFKLINGIKTGVPKFSGEKDYFSTGSVKGETKTSEGKYSFESRPSRANRISSKNDVFQARMKETDKGLIIDEKLQNQLFSTGFLQLRPFGHTYDPKLLYYFIKSPTFLNKRDELATGSTQEALTDTKAVELTIPLPPLNEQKLIVAKLDAIIPRIEAVKRRLENVPTILKRFRQSVLTAAVTGRLTEKWREEHPDVESAEELLKKIKSEREHRYTSECNIAKKKGKRKPKKIHAFKESEIKVPFECPDSWVNTYLGNVIYDFCYGTSNKADYDKKGTPVVRIPNILSKYLDTTDLKYLDSDEENPNNLIDENDILIIRSNGSKDLVGKNCIVPKLKETHAFASYLIRIRPTLLNAEFVFILLNSPVIKEQFFSQSKSSAGINNINTEELGSVEFSLPPLKEQKEIIKQVDKLFNLAEKINAHYLKAKAKVDKLSESILAKAFRGELVLQDPNDEPAEKLFEKILEEKAKMEAELKAAKKKVAGKKKAKKKTKNK